ncbi:PilZ domain-containing protein [Thermodesulfobacteriota bacterium]
MERFDLEIPAKIKIPASGREDEAFDLLTTDISSGGAFFHTSQPLPEGTDVKIDLVLPISKLMKSLEKAKGDSTHTYIKISGTVLRAESKGMAICFNEDYEICPLKGESSTEH